MTIPRDKLYFDGPKGGSQVISGTLWTRITAELTTTYSLLPRVNFNMDVSKMPK